MGLIIIIGAALLVFLFVLFKKTEPEKTEQLTNIDLEIEKYQPNYSDFDEDNFAINLKTIYEGNNKRIEFEYTDAQDTHTKRIVRISSINQKEVNGIPTLRYLKGFCELAKANRTFRSDRISNIIDLQNGEIFNSFDEFIHYIITQINPQQ